MHTTTESRRDGRRRPNSAAIAKGVLALLLLALVVWAGRYLGGYIPRFSEFVQSLGYWAPLAFVIGYGLLVFGFGGG